MLVSTNYANRHQLEIRGVPVGRLIDDLMPEYHAEGSCIAIVATDAPLHPRQLRRLARRVDVGLGRTGSVGNDGSGEIFIAFSTANIIPRDTPRLGHPVDVLAEGQFWTQGAPIDRLFEAVAEARRGGGPQRALPGQHDQRSRGACAPCPADRAHPRPPA